MMCRIDPGYIRGKYLNDQVAVKWILPETPMKGYVFVSHDGMKTQKQLDYWIGLCPEFNKKQKAAKKKKPNQQFECFKIQYRFWAKFGNQGLTGGILFRCLKTFENQGELQG